MKIETEDTAFVLTYTDITSSWLESNAQYKVEDFDSTNDTITFTFVGTKDTTYLFKVEGTNKNTQLDIVATGEVQTISLDVSSWTTEQKESIKLLVVFVETLTASGSIKIMSVVYSTEV